MTEVLGRPVTGEVSHYSSAPAEQWPDEQFLTYLDAVLDCEQVEAVRWHQYIPSFNDGDPCTFTLGEVYVKLVDGDEEAGEYEDGFIDGYNMYDGHWDESRRNYIRTPQPGFEVLYPALDKLGDAMGHFELFLQTNFGDNAEITATKTGFEVGYYDCGY